MGLKEWVRPPRHLLVMFFAITLVSTAALAWLSWQVVRQDRALAIQRAQESREMAADLAVGVLQKHLVEIEAELTYLAALPESEMIDEVSKYSRDLRANSIIVVLTPNEVAAYPSGRLLYYPTVPASAQPPSEVFAPIDVVEFLKKDYAQAILFLDGPSHSSNPAIRAEALVRLGGILRKARRWPEAELAYRELARFGNAPVLGIPAELLARGALCATLTEEGERERAVHEALALYGDLQNGRWQPVRSVYDAYVDQSRTLLGSHAPPVETLESLAIADSVQSIWQDWQSGKGVKSRQTIWTGDRSVLLVARESTNRVVAMAATPGNLQTGWLAELEPLIGSHDARIALTDADDGRPVAGSIDVPSGQQSLRLSNVTGLPWTLSAISVNRASGGAFTGRTQLVIAGLAAIALLVIGGSYLIGRAVARELAVATQQSDFVTAISHEFRTPLTALRQLSELLAKGRVINEDVRKQYYDVLEQESTRLQRLVEGLLKFGRMEAGAMRYQFEAIDTAELVRGLVEEFGREAERRGCCVELQSNDGVPSVRADREALSCVIWNLLDNAVKYSPDCRTVWVDVLKDNDRVAIRVRDHGVGISQEDKQRIFQKFVRGDVAKTLGVQGTGIGLAVARQIISGHGGEIKLESQPGVGSTFSVLLPITPS